MHTTSSSSCHASRMQRCPSALAASLANLLLLCAFLAVCGGCAAPRTGRIWSPAEHSVPPELSFLFPGDEVEITFLGAPNLSSRQVVGRGGKLNLPLVGEVHAAGKTPDALRTELQQLYAKHIQATETSVVVRSNPPVYVTGAVKKPGRIPLDFPMTVLEAVAASGGFDEYEAEMRNVVVIRHENGQRYGYSLNLKEALQGETVPVFHLHPLDIVYVPRTRIARVDQWVDQYINKLIPRMGITVSSEGETFYGL